MFAFAFLLCLVELLTTSGALQTVHPADHSRAQKPLEKKQPSNFESRRKRQAIPEKYLDAKYLPEAYYGDRSSALISLYVENPKRFFNVDLGHSFGVRIQSRLVLTVCSAVTYVADRDRDVRYYRQYPESEPVTKIPYADISVQLIRTENTVVLIALETVIHPRCDNQYLVDLAIVATKEALPGTRYVWIHAAENLLFRRALDRVVAANAVLGRCSVPVYKRDKRWTGQIRGIGFANINFQNWDACRDMVCPFYTVFPDTDHTINPDRCDNLLNGTRKCISWNVPKRLTDLGMGTPIFCDVGNIHGLMGFIVTQTYSTVSPNIKDAVMQGLDDGIDWVRGILREAVNVEYEKQIPAWMKNLRQNYSGDWLPTKIKVLSPYLDKGIVEFKNFVGNQILSVVLVYFKNRFRCRGTLVAHEFAVVPCSCITNQIDLTEENNILKAQPVRYIGNPDQFTVSLMINGSYPFVEAADFFIHKKCDSHYLYESGYIKLAKQLPNHKLAWVMTAYVDLLKQMLYITSVADSSMGYNCYWLNNEIAKPYNYFRKAKIRFVPWTNCVDSICPNNVWRNNHKDRCFGYHEPLKSSLFCIEAVEKNWPACGIEHGTPIYCNVEQARGFIGYVSRALDLWYDLQCHRRASNNQFAVMVSIEQLLPDISLLLWINAVEQLIRARAAYHAETGLSSCQLLEPSSILLLFTVFSIAFRSMLHKII